MQKMRVKDIDKAVEKFASLHKSDDEYTFYYELVLKHFEKMIWKIISGYNLSGQKEDFFNECVIKLPEIAKRWDKNKSSFSTYLFTSLRGKVQLLAEQMKLIPHSRRANKYYAKKQIAKNKIPKPHLQMDVGVYHIEGMKNFDDSAKAQDRLNEKLFPSVLPNIEETIDFEKIVTLINKVKNGDMWLDYHIHDKTLKEIALEYNLSSSTMASKRIERVHKIVRVKLLKLMAIDDKP